MLRHEKFDVGHLGSVTFAGSKARNAEVAALTCCVTRSHSGEQTVDRLRSHKIGGGLATGVDSPALAERDHLLDERAGRLALGDGRLNAIHEDNGGDKVAQHGAAMA